AAPSPSTAPTPSTAPAPNLADAEPAPEPLTEPALSEADNPATDPAPSAPPAAVPVEPGEPAVTIVASASEAPLQVTTVSLDAPVFVDESIVLAEVPEELIGASLVQTANADRLVDHSGTFLQLRCAENARALVAYDSRLSLPDWMAQTELDRRFVATSNGVRYRLFVVPMAANQTVTLGPNLTSDTNTPGSHYFVMVTHAAALAPALTDDPADTSPEEGFDVPALAALAPDATPAEPPSMPSQPTSSPADEAQDQAAERAAKEAQRQSARAALAAILEQPTTRLPADLAPEWTPLLQAVAAARPQIKQHLIANSERIARREIDLKLGRASSRIIALDANAIHCRPQGMKDGSAPLPWNRVSTQQLIDIATQLPRALDEDTKQTITLLQAVTGDHSTAPEAWRDTLVALMTEPSERQEIALLPRDAKLRTTSGRKSEWKALNDSNTLTSEGWLSVDAKTNLAEMNPRVALEQSFLRYRFEVDPDLVYRVFIRARCMAKNDRSSRDAVTVVFEDADADIQGEPLRFKLPKAAAYCDGFANYDGFMWISGQLKKDKDKLIQQHPIDVRYTNGGDKSIRIHLAQGPMLIDTIWLSATQRKRPSADTRPPPLADQQP
ncbi:MAG: hypothetical protein PF961_02295, partial [Planctomycetota bacterium]|nr:hypothetical protein [Planctomycetota bacterium]